MGKAFSSLKLGPTGLHKCDITLSNRSMEPGTEQTSNAVRLKALIAIVSIQQYWKVVETDS